MSRGTVLYIGGFKLPDGNAAAHRVLGTAKALRMLGYDVALIGVADTPQGLVPGVQRGSTDDFDTWSIPYPRSLMEWVRYAGSIEALVGIASEYERVSTVICYNYPAVALFRTLRFCRDRAIQCICDCTEWYALPRRFSLFGVLRVVDTFLRMRVLQKWVDGVICISRYLRDYYDPYTKTVLVPPLVDTGDPKWRDPGDMSHRDEVVFVYAGTLGEHKDKLSVVIDALGRVGPGDYVFKIMGISEAEYREAHPGQDEVLAMLGECVCFLGRLPHPQSVSELRLADYQFIVRECTRSNNAGFPTKFVESVTCATPVIATRCSDLEDYVEDGVTGFFVSGVPEDLADLLARAISREVSPARIIEQGTFDYSRFVQSIGDFMISVRSGVNTSG